MVVWIEIYPLIPHSDIHPVTTCVVVWIEIILLMALFVLLIVTTCVVVWIEIIRVSVVAFGCRSHHLRGGVD